MDLDALCAKPDPLDTLEAWDRLTHTDLARLSRPELMRERNRIRLRLLLDDAADEWFAMRLSAIEEELRRAS